MGGVGGIGALIYEWNASICDRPFVLVGRSGRGKHIAPAKFTSLLTIQRVNLCVRSETERLVSCSVRNVGRVLHMSGVLKDSILMKQTFSTVSIAFANKTQGAQAVCHENLPQMFVNFKSFIDNIKTKKININYWK